MRATRTITTMGLLFGLLAAVPLALSVAVKPSTLPNEVSLVYPVSGSVVAGTMVQIGMNSEDGEKPYYGVFLNISTSITYPNATQVPFISTSNYNPINVDSPQSCNGSPSGAFGSIQLNETGQYTARWTYTWVFPKSTNSTGNSFTCTGFGSTEELNIQKTFNVTAADGSTHPPAITPTASTEATFSVSPTGTVYVMRNSGAGTLQRQSTQRLVGSSILVAVALLFA